MNPLDKTFANNALKYGVSGLNIDECRVDYQSDYDKSQATPQGICTSKEISAIGAEPDAGRDMERVGFNRPELKGRFPANFLYDGSEEVLELFPQTGGGGKPRLRNRETSTINFVKSRPEYEPYGDTRNGGGSAARFFYCAKASKAERGVANSHPTVKPLALMEYLVKLVKMPSYNLILDPFMGSGTTLLACAKLGIPCI
jgi:site-specific DNA-methyltransferase (adenine-specific)